MHRTLQETQSSTVSGSAILRCFHGFVHAIGNCISPAELIISYWIKALRNLIMIGANPLTQEPHHLALSPDCRFWSLLHQALNQDKLIMCRLRMSLIRMKSHYFYNTQLPLIDHHPFVHSCLHLILPPCISFKLSTSVQVLFSFFLLTFTLAFSFTGSRSYIYKVSREIDMCEGVAMMMFGFGPRPQCV